MRKTKQENENVGSSAEHEKNKEPNREEDAMRIDDNSTELEVDQTGKTINIPYILERVFTYIIQFLPVFILLFTRFLIRNVYFSWTEYVENFLVYIIVESAIILMSSYKKMDRKALVFRFISVVSIVFSAIAYGYLVLSEKKDVIAQRIDQIPFWIVSVIFLITIIMVDFLSGELTVKHMERKENEVTDKQ